MTEVIKKKGVRSGPITITPAIRQQIKEFRERLIMTGSMPEETSAFDARTIDIIINELDDYDRNMILAYYSVADGSPMLLARLLKVSPPVVIRRMRKIVNKIKELNDIPKSPNNKPRVNPCD